MEIIKKLFLFLLVGGLVSSCIDDQVTTNISKDESKSEQVVSEQTPDMEQLESDLKEKGYQTFKYEEGDSTYLMQQYYMVFLKSGSSRSQDSTEAAELQKKHLAHLERMALEGYTSLTGPMGDDGELRGIVVYNTATQKEADSLAKLDPMVKAGRLKVEVHPWWVAKGGKLN